MSYVIMISPVARKQLDKIRKEHKQKIIDTIRQLEFDPIKSRAKVDIKKLVGIRGQSELYRLRVGSFRIIYEVSETTIWISEIVKRSSAYKFLL